MYIEDNAQNIDKTSCLKKNFDGKRLNILFYHGDEQNFYIVSKVKQHLTNYFQLTFLLVSGRWMKSLFCTHAIPIYFVTRNT